VLHKLTHLRAHKQKLEQPKQALKPNKQYQLSVKKLTTSHTRRFFYGDPFQQTNIVPDTLTTLQISTHCVWKPSRLNVNSDWSAVALL